MAIISYIAFSESQAIAYSQTCIAREQYTVAQNVILNAHILKNIIRDILQCSNLLLCEGRLLLVLVQMRCLKILVWIIFDKTILLCFMEKLLY